MTILTVAADGWQAGYSGTPPTFTPDTSPETVLLSRTGWDAASAAVGTTPVTGISETLVINRRVRDLYPNQANDITTATAFSPANAVALSDFVYASDVVTSGGSAVTNSSAKVSPVPIAAWATPDRSLVGNSIGAGSGTEVEIVAFHRNGRNGRMVAAVVFSFTDGTNTVTSSVVSSTVISTRTGDKNPMPVYRCPTVDITSLNTGLVTVNAKVYPWIGGTASVLDSSTLTAAREFSPRYFSKNVTRAASPPLAYISSTGNDTTHAGWSTTAATAAAAPYLTLKGALDDLATAFNSAVTGSIVDGCRVRIVNTVATGLSVTTNRGQNIAGLVIERAPGTARASAVLVFNNAFGPKLGTGLTSPITEAQIVFSDLTMSRTANVIPINGITAGVQLRCVYDGVDFQNGGFTGALMNQGSVYIYDFSITGYAGSLLGLSTPEFRITRGLSADVNSGTPEGWVTLASTITRVRGLPARDATKGAIFFCNKFVNPDSTTAPIAISAAATGDTITGFVAVQNLVEVTHTTASTPALRVSSDTPAHGNTVHTILALNTVTGYGSVGRYNILYDNTIGETRVHDLYVHEGDLIAQLNTKGDVFSANAAQTGQMAYTHGVAARANISQFRTNSGIFSSEMQVYPGVGSLIGTSDTTAQFTNSTVWTDYRGTTGSAGTPVIGTGGGVGGGTYTMVSGSPALNLLKVVPLAFDLAGTARNTTSSSSGAYANLDTQVVDLLFTGGGMTTAGTWTLRTAKSLTYTGGAMAMAGTWTLAPGVGLSFTGGGMTASGTWTTATVKTLTFSGSMTMLGTWQVLATTIPVGDPFAGFRNYVAFAQPDDGYSVGYT